MSAAHTPESPPTDISHQSGVPDDQDIPQRLAAVESAILQGFPDQELAALCTVLNHPGYVPVLNVAYRRAVATGLIHRSGHAHDKAGLKRSVSLEVNGRVAAGRWGPTPSVETLFPAPWTFDVSRQDAPPERSGAAVYAAESSLICRTGGRHAAALAKLITESVNQRLHPTTPYPLKFQMGEKVWLASTPSYLITPEGATDYGNAKWRCIWHVSKEPIEVVGVKLGNGKLFYVFPGDGNDDGSRMFRSREEAVELVQAKNETALPDYIMSLEKWYSWVDDPCITAVVYKTVEQPTDAPSYMRVWIQAPGWTQVQVKKFHFRREPPEGKEAV